MTQKLPGGVAVALALSIGAAAQSGNGAQPRAKLSLDQPAPLVIDRALPSGGTVSLDLNVGDVKILPSAATGHVRLEIDPNGFYDQQTLQGWVRRFDVDPASATIQLELPKNSHGHSSPEVALYVPATADLRISLGVGDLNIHGIRGDKDLHVGVGDLTIALDDTPDYGHVEISTRIGDVHDPLNPAGQHGFLGQNEDFVLKGRYRLRATVGVGDVRLVRRSG